MELSLIGLQNAGKTSLVNVIAVSKQFMRFFSFSISFLSFGLMLIAKSLFLELISRLVDIVKTWSQRCVIFLCESLSSFNFDPVNNSAWELSLYCHRFPLTNLHDLTLGIYLYLQVGFNMRKVTKGNVTIKLWDLGGQPRFRSMWERYCRAVSAIVYVPLIVSLNPFLMHINISVYCVWTNKRLIPCTLL